MSNVYLRAHFEEAHLLLDVVYLRAATESHRKIMGSRAPFSSRQSPSQAHRGHRLIARSDGKELTPDYLEYSVEEVRSSFRNESESESGNENENENENELMTSTKKSERRL